MAIQTAQAVIERSFALNVTPARVLASSEGGVFIAYVNRDHMANIEIFNTGHIFAATTHRNSVNVWSVSTEDIDAAIERIRDHFKT